MCGRMSGGVGVEERLGVGGGRLMAKRRGFPFQKSTQRQSGRAGGETSQATLSITVGLTVNVPEFMCPSTTV